MMFTATQQPDRIIEIKSTEIKILRYKQFGSWLLTVLSWRCTSLCFAIFKTGSFGQNIGLQIAFEVT